jgi:hypothetical protein
MARMLCYEMSTGMDYLRVVDLEISGVRQSFFRPMLLQDGESLVITSEGGVVRVWLQEKERAVA